MSKDWRISVCTRYRPLTVFILVIIVWAFSTLSFVTVARFIQKNQAPALNAKLASVKVGTEKSKLIEVLGKPNFIERVKSRDINWLPGTDAADLDRIRAVHTELVKYTYYKTIFMMDPIEYSVFLDENGERTVSLPSRLLGLWVETNSRQFMVLLSGVLAVVVWLCFRSWCARRMRKQGHGPSPDGHPEM